MALSKAHASLFLQTLWYLNMYPIAVVLMYIAAVLICNGSRPYELRCCCLVYS